MPPAAALSRDMVTLGVSEKQKDRARLVFERSAEQAGFFEQGNQRLVMQGVAYQPEAPQERTGAKNLSLNLAGGTSRRPLNYIHSFKG